MKDVELVQALAPRSADEILKHLFACFPINCINLHRLDQKTFDALAEQLDENTADKSATVLKMVQLLRSVSDFSVEELPTITKIKQILERSFTEELSIDQVATLAGISKYYMCHLFKTHTGLTVTEYKNALRLSKAKRLLVNGEMRIVDIAYACGFSDESYFAKKFRESEGISPTKYRELLAGQHALTLLKNGENHEASNHSIHS